MPTMLETEGQPGLLTEDRRREERSACCRAAELRSPTARPSDPPTICEAANLSRHGALLVCDAAVPAGTYWRLHVDGPPVGPDAVISREVRVQHCRCNPDDGKYDVGVLFC